MADLPDRGRLRSSSSFRYEFPRLKLKFGERSFSFSGPKAWNSLPSNLQELTNTDTYVIMSNRYAELRPTRTRCLSTHSFDDAEPD